MNGLIKNAYAVFTVVTLIVACARNPVTGKKQIVLMSEQQEIAMGQQADPEIVATFGLYPDSAIQRFINEKGKQMAAISHRPALNWTFRVLDADVINAFAVPGGYVYFTRGILANMNNEAQFAGVLGHEIGHVTARHTVSQQTRQVLGQIGIIAAVIAKPELAQFAEAASQGLQLMYLKNSRDAESQSDELGVEYSSKVGYDAKEMAKFFQTLDREMAYKSGNQRLPEFLSTHPDPGNRYTTVTNLATQWQTTNNKTNMTINRNSYLRMVNGIVYGEDPRQGYRENNVFYHPELKFQFNTPAGWQYQNTPQQVMLAPTDGAAMLMLSLGKGNTPREAAQNFIQAAKLQVTESRDITVNGLNAYALVGSQMQQDQSGRSVPAVTAIIYFIQYNNVIYQLIGASTPANFSTYAGMLRPYMDSFKALTDASKINVKPERIEVVTVSRNQTLKQLFESYKLPAARFEELAIMNGMQQTDNLTTGMLVKIVVKR
ncbi:MAG: M48 family metalloprotease [Chitinophagaceae bacterium]|nr:M48 family metalloprotease [Chitinophagaceae bacterium]